MRLRFACESAKEPGKSHIYMYVCMYVCIEFCGFPQILGSFFQLKNDKRDSHLLTLFSFLFSTLSNRFPTRFFPFYHTRQKLSTEKSPLSSRGDLLKSAPFPSLRYPEEKHDDIIIRLFTKFFILTLVIWNSIHMNDICPCRQC